MSVYPLGRSHLLIRFSRTAKSCERKMSLLHYVWYVVCNFHSGDLYMYLFSENDCSGLQDSFIFFQHPLIEVPAYPTTTTADVTTLAAEAARNLTVTYRDLYHDPDPAPDLDLDTSRLLPSTISPEFTITTLVLAVLVLVLSALVLGTTCFSSAKHVAHADDVTSNDVITRYHGVIRRGIPSSAHAHNVNIVKNVHTVQNAPAAQVHRYENSYADIAEHPFSVGVGATSAAGARDSGEEEFPGTPLEYIRSACMSDLVTAVYGVWKMALLLNMDGRQMNFFVPEGCFFTATLASAITTLMLNADSVMVARRRRGDIMAQEQEQKEQEQQGDRRGLNTEGEGRYEEELGGSYLRESGHLNKHKREQRQQHPKRRRPEQSETIYPSQQRHRQVRSVCSGTVPV